jgi:hypothetical protein
MEEELKEKIVAVLNDYAECFEYEYDKDMTSRTVADQILDLFKEAGWKSPEEWNKNEIKWMNIVQGMREANGTV